MLVEKLIFSNSRVSNLIKSKVINNVISRCMLSNQITPFNNTSWSFNSYKDIINNLQKDDAFNNQFWSDLARQKLYWKSSFTKVNECDFKTGNIKWFSDGVINASYNCVDRHLEKAGDRVALIWEKDEPGQHELITFNELHNLVNQAAAVLQSQGVQRGHTVVVYMPVTPILVSIMLACARIGAIHSVVFAGFSAQALATRIQDAGARLVVTADQAVRGGKRVELKRVVDEALKSCPLVDRVLVQQRTGDPSVPMSKRDLPLNYLMEQVTPSDIPILANMIATDPLFILYTSGSTGKPKGVVHSTGGYLLYAAMTYEHVFDSRPLEDRFGCVADIGWITGHSYVVYGPLCNGATTLLFESTPIYPNPGRYWEMVERLRLSHVYLSPTALRLLLKFGDEWVCKYDRSSLRVLGCVGEPLNQEAWKWFHEVVGEKRCDIVDTWWQTETGGIMISPRPSAKNMHIVPGMPMRPFYGVHPVLLDEKGKELRGNDVHGALCIKKSWPGMAIGIWKDEQRFNEVYLKHYPGYYFTGDGAHRHADGHYQITGRMDDVINVSGHRIGTAEVEDALNLHHDVAESAVVGFPHEVKGEGIYAFITLKESVCQRTEAERSAELRNFVRQEIGGFAVPDVILIAPGLPKTRSGKIMRRVLRKIAADRPDELGDISTLAEPDVVEWLVKEHVRLFSQRK